MEMKTRWLKRNGIKKSKEIRYTKIHELKHCFIYKRTCINSYYTFFWFFYQQESECGGNDGNKSTLYQSVESSVINENDAYVLLYSIFFSLLWNRQFYFLFTILKIWMFTWYTNSVHLHDHSYLSDLNLRRWHLSVLGWGILILKRHSFICNLYRLEITLLRHDSVIDMPVLIVLDI